jgi:hypothetical protein
MLMDTSLSPKEGQGSVGSESITDHRQTPSSTACAVSY